MKYSIQMLVLICCLAITGLAKPAHEMDLKDSHVEVPWNEFRTILEKTTEPVVETPKDVIYSPVDVLITGAEITGKIHEHKLARFTAVCKVSVPLSRNIEKNGWVILPLGNDKSSHANGAVLESAELNGKSVPVESRGGINRVLISRKGEHTLKLSYYVPVQSQEGTWSLNCGFPAAAAGQLKLTIPDSRAEIKLNGIKRTTSTKGNSTLLSTPLTLESDVAIRYSLVGDEQGTAAGMTPKTFAETGMLVTIKENRIDYRYRVSYQIWHQKKQTFELLLPDSLPVEGVHGAGLTSWTVEKRDTGSVLVASIGFVPERDYTLTVEFSKKLETVQGSVSIPKLSALGVNRESGYLTVQAPKTVEVFSEEMQQLTAVSNRELPLWLRNENDLLMRFKYTRDYNLKLTVRRHKDMPVLVAIADEASFNGIITKDGYRLIKYRYFIRNNHKQYLALTLPQGWELWSALIDGEAVMPAASDNESTVQIPLKKMSKINEGSGFVLELVYWYEGESMGSSGKIAMQTPIVDINCQKLNGILRVPTEYKYDNFKGSLENVQNSVENKYLSRSSTRSNPRRSGSKSKKQIFRQNIPIQANSISLSKVGKSLSLPVEIDIPEVGKNLLFSRNLVVPGEKGDLSFSYGKEARNMRPIFRGIFTVISLLIGYLALRFLFFSIADRKMVKRSLLMAIGGFIILFVCNNILSLHTSSLIPTWIFGGMAALLTFFGRSSKKEVA